MFTSCAYKIACSIEHCKQNKNKHKRKVMVKICNRYMPVSNGKHMKSIPINPIDTQ